MNIHAIDLVNAAEALRGRGQHTLAAPLMQAVQQSAPATVAEFARSRGWGPQAMLQNLFQQLPPAIVAKAVADLCAPTAVLTTTPAATAQIRTLSSTPQYATAQAPQQIRTVSSQPLK